MSEDREQDFTDFSGTVPMTRGSLLTTLYVCRILPETSPHQSHHLGAGLGTGGHAAPSTSDGWGHDKYKRTDWTRRAAWCSPRGAGPSRAVVRSNYWTEGLSLHDLAPGEHLAESGTQRRLPTQNKPGDPARQLRASPACGRGL